MCDYFSSVSCGYDILSCVGDHYALTCCCTVGLARVCVDVHVPILIAVCVSVLTIPVTSHYHKIRSRYSDRDRRCPVCVGRRNRMNFNHCASVSRVMTDTHTQTHHRQPSAAYSRGSKVKRIAYTIYVRWCVLASS